MTKNLKYNLISKKFISIDSFDVNNLNFKIPNKEQRNYFESNSYYLVKIGYYIEDTAFLNKTMRVFNEIKTNFQKLKNKRIVKIDANCQNYLNVYSDVKKFEEISNTRLTNSIFIEVAKFKEPVYRLSRGKNCNF
jgi:hypothetical protein